MTSNKNVLHTLLSLQLPTKTAGPCWNAASWLPLVAAAEPALSVHLLIGTSLRGAWGTTTLKGSSRGWGRPCQTHNTSESMAADAGHRPQIRTKPGFWARPPMQDCWASPTALQQASGTLLHRAAAHGLAPAPRRPDSGPDSEVHMSQSWSAAVHGKPLSPKA